MRILMMMMLSLCPERLALAGGPDFAGAAAQGTFADVVVDVSDMLRPGFGPAEDRHGSERPVAAPFPQWMC